MLLADEVVQFLYDPLGFVMYAFPWGVDELVGETGPDTWQAEFLTQLGEAVRANGFDGVNAVPPVRMARASGHGIGKSALASWVILWIMSTRPNAIGTVTANTATQLETKTWSRCFAG